MRTGTAVALRTASGDTRSRTVGVFSGVALVFVEWPVERGPVPAAAVGAGEADGATCGFLRGTSVIVTGAAVACALLVLGG